MKKEILKIEAFRAMEDEAKFDLLYREGSYVGKRKLRGQDLILFQLDHFYVEIHYKKYRRQVDHLLITADPAILQPYLDQINIAGL